MEPHKRRIEYSRKVFAMRQVRDCVAGSDSVKRSGELYAPMPSGMSMMNSATATTGTGQGNPLTDRSINLSDAPWYNGNPAYSAYIHRAKFPDITNNTLRGLVGVATRENPEVKLTGSIAYMEELATLDGQTIYDLYESCVSEIFQVGRHALVLDIREDNTMYFAQYASETYINWQMEVINGKRVQTYAEFETCDIVSGEEVKKSLVYSLEMREGAKKHTCWVYKYTNGKLDGEDGVELTFQGKALEFVPVVNIGAERNDPSPDACPLLGVSDCALDIYRHSADLNQAQFMTCNPTLLFTGVDDDDAPKVIGSTVAICLSDPGSDGKYLSTDTSALGHVKEYIQDVFQEAIQYGASLLGPSKRAAESAEALSLRQSSASATLVTIVTRVGAAIENGLEMASGLTSGVKNSVEFNPNYEFAELTLSSQDVLALLNSWMSGGISRLTFLENMQAAGILMDRTPEEEIGQMDDEGIVTAPELEAEKAKQPDVIVAPEKDMTDNG